MTDGTSAAAEANATEDLTTFFALKKKSDPRLRGGVSYDQFLQMKQEGEFQEFNAFSDAQIQALFLQWAHRILGEWMCVTDPKGV